MKRKRILLDCDGVLADFCTACFNLIERHTGDRHTHEEVTHWDLFTVVGKGHLKPLMKETAAKSGWCLSFPIYPGAQDFVRGLEELGEVVIVTSPMSTPYWAYERTIWLEQHFGIPKGRIVHTEGKQYVKGDVLIDDADENCFKWHKEYSEALTLLWDAPYNREVDLTGTGIVRVKSWSEALAAIEAHKWEIEEVDDGPVGTEDFWICRQCGASGGPVCYTDGTKHESPPSFPPFLADGSGLKLTHDCEEPLRMIQEYVDLDTH